MLDTKQIEHAFKRHGSEKMKGQLDITKEDFIRYAEILLDPHRIELGKNVPNSIWYMRRYPDGTVVCVERQLKGKNLHFKTMWKEEMGKAPVILLVGTTLGNENRWGDEDE